MHYPLVPTTTAPVATTTGPVATAPAEPPPITFSPLEERLEVVFTASTDADQRDRLSNLRELLHAMRAKDPIAQRRVYDFADEQLKIEARSLPQSLPVDDGPGPIATPIEERPLGQTPPSPIDVLPSTAPSSTVQLPPTVALPTIPLPAAPSAADLLATARTQFAGSSYLDAIATLAPLTSAEAVALRKEAVDAWARSEREAAGAEFLAARALPAGPDRTAALQHAHDRLVAINARFPDNTFAATIADNIAKVGAELTP